MSKKTNHKPLPPLAYLEQLLAYEAHTGDFTWKARPLELFKTERICNSWNTKYAGTKVGFVNPRGYVVIKIDGKQYKGHRLAYYLGTGTDPESLTVDHIDPRNKSDNRLCNLRLATHAEQNKNCSERSDNTSGVTGVHWDKQKSKFRSQIRVDGKSISIGYFDNFDEAVRARKVAERELGFSENHGIKSEEYS